jgi:hypothetical protein
LPLEAEGFGDQRLELGGLVTQARQVQRAGFPGEAVDFRRLDFDLKDHIG